MQVTGSEQSGRRVLIEWEGKNYYLYVSDTDIMFSGPGESDLKYQETFSTINLICRMVSIARNNGVPWSKILKQFEAVSYGRTLVSRIAIAVRDYVER